LSATGRNTDCVTDDAGDATPGVWIVLGSAGPATHGRIAALGYEAYTDVIHDPKASRPPDDLPQEKMRLLLPILRDHTTTPDDCFFGQWTVWGNLMWPRDRAWCVRRRWR
jgi:hypothetical protein